MLAKDIKIGDRLMSLIDRGNHIKKGDIVTVKEIDKSGKQAQILVHKKDDEEYIGIWVFARSFEKVIE